MKRFPRGPALLCILTLSPAVYATVMVPTKVYNDTQVTIRITVTRAVSCVGSDQSRSGPWVIVAILAPARSGTLLLMGGAEGLCISGTKSLEIVTAQGADKNPKNEILPLSITEGLPNHWMVLHVLMDPLRHRFMLREIDPVR